MLALLGILAGVTAASAQDPDAPAQKTPSAEPAEGAGSGTAGPSKPVEDAPSEKPTADDLPTPDDPPTADDLPTVDEIALNDDTADPDAEADELIEELDDDDEKDEEEAEKDPKSLLPLAVSSSAEPLASLLPNQTASSTGSVSVSSPGPWTLHVSDTTSPSPAPGHLLRSGCLWGPDYLEAPLRVEVQPADGAASSHGERALGAGPTSVASGPAGEARLRAEYRQPVGAERLLSGCSYTIAVTFTIAPS